MVLPTENDQYANRREGASAQAQGDLATGPQQFLIHSGAQSEDESAQGDLTIGADAALTAVLLQASKMLNKVSDSTAESEMLAIAPDSAPSQRPQRQVRAPRLMHRNTAHGIHTNFFPTRTEGEATEEVARQKEATKRANR